MRTIFHILMVAAASAVQTKRGGNRIGKQVVGGLAYLARNSVADVGVQQQTAMQKLMQQEHMQPLQACPITGTCWKYGLGSSSQKEQDLKDEVVTVNAMLKKMTLSVQILERKVSALSNVAIPLGGFVALLTTDQRNELIAALEARDPIGALDDLVKDIDNPNPFARMIPGFDDMVKTVKDVNDAADQVEKDYASVEAELPVFKAKTMDYLINDTSEGSLGMLMKQFRGLEDKTKADAIGMKTSLKTTIVSLLRCVKTSIKNKSFDSKDWDAAVKNAQATIGDTFSLQTDLLALQSKSIEVEKKAEEIFEPTQMDIDA